MTSEKQNYWIFFQFTFNLLQITQPGEVLRSNYNNL